VTLGTAQVIRGNARALPLADDSVDLVVTSPPYFALRSYTDAGEHYADQIGDEPTPEEFIDSLVDVTRECARVLKRTGSIWVNLGDKYSDRAGPGWQGSDDGVTGRHQKPPRRSTTGMAPRKSLLGLPWRYALRCLDDLGLTLRAEVIWDTSNGLPESVNDRVRRSHEQWFHFTLQERYFSAVDALREPHAEVSIKRASPHRSPAGRRGAQVYAGQNGQTLDLAQSIHPLGKLPGSVWRVSTEPLNVPDHVSHAICCDGTPRPGCEDGVDHYAAFPSEWPKRLIAGWSPNGICTVCGEGRRPVVASVGLDLSRPQARRAHALAVDAGLTDEHFSALLSVGISDTGRGAATQNGTGKNSPRTYQLADHARSVLGGYAREYLLRRPTRLADSCGCPAPTASTTPAVVLDPFGGTGTTAMAAKALGRRGISLDMSADYCRIAEWRTNDRDQLAKVLGVAKAAPVHRDEQSLFDLLGGTA
jgi:DNA modification methylase